MPPPHCERGRGRLYAEPGRPRPRSLDFQRRSYENLFVTDLSPRRWFDDAIKRGDVQAACSWAIQMPIVDLERALKLTILVGEQEMPGYPKFARRWLIRFIHEQSPGFDTIAAVARALKEIPVFIERDEAKYDLLELGRLIRERELGKWKPGSFGA
jgi:hypothetical protein